MAARRERMMTDGGVNRDDKQISTPAVSTPTKVPDSRGPAAGSPGGESGVPAVTTLRRHAEIHLERYECGNCGEPWAFSVSFSINGRFVNGQICGACEHELIFGCYDCATPYPFPLDTRVDDDLWARISPDGEGNGLLCANCIVARLARLDPSPIVVKMTPVWAEEYE